MPSEMKGTCLYYNPDNYGICEQCVDGYLRVTDQGICVEECPENYTMY